MSDHVMMEKLIEWCNVVKRQMKKQNVYDVHDTLIEKENLWKESHKGITRLYWIKHWVNEEITELTKEWLYKWVIQQTTN